jgi:hypothetical protein
MVDVLAKKAGALRVGMVAIRPCDNDRYDQVSLSAY